MVVERVLFQVNARTAMSVGQASGLALAAAARAGCPVAQYSPNEVKLAVAGYGVGHQRAGAAHGAGPARPATEPPRPADRADALALAICHLTGAGCGPRPPPVRLQPAGGAPEAGVIGSLRGVVLDRAARPARPPRCCSRWAGSATGCWCRAGALAQIGAPGSPAFLHVHTHVREDAIVLYGFPSRDERACFEALIGAHGVGPAVALALLSVHSPAALQRAVLTEDADALMLVPGIGKKTAIRLLDRAQGPARRRPRRGRAPARGDRRPAARPPGGGGEPAATRAEVRAALAGLGYGADEIRQALARLPAEGALEDQIRLALRELAGSPMGRADREPEQGAAAEREARIGR